MLLRQQCREKFPFQIKMADGEKYEMYSRDRIIIAGTRIVLVDRNDIPHVLPLPTMTGLTYLPRKNGRKKS